MPRINFGGGQDYSGVFASLANEDMSRIEASVRRAASQSAQDQDAKDQDFYSQWKNGQVSDQQWLDYIKQRMVDSAGDPEAQGKWADMLRENTNAIEDAQAETNFRLGKISAQALLSHYRNRMSGVEQNSPAYRDVAERYQQLVDYVKGGGGGSGGGGGGGGSGDNGSAVSIKNYIDNQNRVSDSGYSAEGEDVIAPTSDFYGVGSVKHYIDTLLANQDRIRDMMDQYKNDPTLLYLTDHLTGQRVANAPDMLHALDNQYLRNQDALGTVYDAQGKPKDAVKARTDKGTYISTYMADHNTDRIEPAYSAFQRTLVDAWKAASDLDPDQRMAVYRQTEKMVKDFEDGAFPGTDGRAVREFVKSFSKVQESGDPLNAQTAGGQSQITKALPPELKASGAFLEVLSGWEALHRAVLDPNLSDEERVMMADEAIRLIPGSVDPTTKVGTRGERSRLTETQVRDMIYGNPLDDTHKSTTLGPGYTGAFATLVQKDGINNTDPNFDGQRFVYQVNPDGSNQVVEADGVANDDGQSLHLVPVGKDRSSLIQVAIKVGNRTVMAYAEPQPIPINLLPPGMAVYASAKGFSAAQMVALTGNQNASALAAGAFLPSSVIKAKGKAWVDEQVRIGALQRTSPVWGTIIHNPDGQKTIWFQDAKTGLLSTKMDLSNSEIDPVTKGILVGDDGVPAINDEPFSGGSPIAFGAGMSKKEMYGFIKNNVLSGVIDLNSFKVRGEGTSVGGPPSIEDVLAPFNYGHPMGPRQRGSGHADLEDSLDEQRKAKTKAWLQQVVPLGLGKAIGNSLDDAFDSIKGFSDQAGIKLQGLPTAAGMREGGGQQPVQGDLPTLARHDALDAMKAREAALRFPKVGLQPIFTPPPVARAPLPKRQAPLASMDPAPILGLPRSAPAPVAPVAKPAVRTQTTKKPPKVGGFKETNY